MRRTDSFFLIHLVGLHTNTHEAQKVIKMLLENKKFLVGELEFCLSDQV